MHLEPQLGLVQVAAADGLHLYWHHYVDRIAKALNGKTGQAIWSPHVHLLAVPDGTRGRTVFNLAKLDQVQPCRS
ncbi:hypothetical protein HER39_11650 [Arthrobacter deserti]|uniref:Uncharacterized protein n=1 Tax=Arthrobacter deserti TaxID=1742687 RepID=A0ABX1JS99_9MICC|nr:hypothetical protein [Arthrobacter deserti]